MVAVHQFVPSYSARSAIGLHTRNVTAVLHGMGLASDTYVGEARGIDDIEVRHFHQYRPAGGGTAAGPTWLLYQLSTGSPMAGFLAGRREPLVVNYHNITPADLVEPWEPLVVPELVAGRRQLAQLAARTSLAVAVSAYNGAELAAAGYPNTTVVPVLADYDQLGAVADGVTEDRLRRAKEGGGADWLFVGRINPNKCQHDVVKAFAAYRRLYDPRARLWLVGGSSSHAYLTAIERFVVAAGLQGAVTLTGSVSQEVLTAHHRTADVVVCLSEHEGFCVPLVEAMWHRVPIVALAAAAVPETVRSAGLLLHDKAPATVAAAVHRVLSDGALRRSVQDAGSARLDDLGLERAGALFAQAVRALVEGGGGLAAPTPAATGNGSRAGSPAPVPAAPDGG